MLRYCGLTLLVLGAMPGTAWSHETTDTEYPEGTQDGPCPDVGFTKPLKWKGISGTWNEQLRMSSALQPHQCPTSNTYGGVPPNVTVTIEVTNPDGSIITIPRLGVIGNDPNQRLFSNDHPSPGFPDPNGLLFETIHTNYRNIHIFWTCANLEGNKNIHYVWIESRSPTIRKRLQKKLTRRLADMGIDVSRFWKVGMEYCTEE